MVAFVPLFCLHRLVQSYHRKAFQTQEDLSKPWRTYCKRNVRFLRPKIARESVDYCCDILAKCVSSLFGCENQICRSD